MPVKSRPTVLVLWNQVEEDIYERWRAEGPRPLDWDPDRLVPDVGTVAEEIASLERGIRQCGYDVKMVNVEDSLDRLLAAVRLHRPDVVMNLVEFFNDDASQEAYVAGLFELLGLCYTGSPPLALATCQNKYRTKLVLEAAGLPTAAFCLMDREPVASNHELEFPLIVKPVLEDASGGIDMSSVVLDQGALEVQVRRILAEYQMPALVEEYIEGREIHAAVLGNKPGEVLPLFEMEFDDYEFNPDEEWRPQIITYRAKWDPHSPEFYSMDAVCPAEDLDDDLAAYIADVAQQAYGALGCRDYARVDMRVDEEEGEVYILEVNPNPDLSDGAAYMQCAAASGRTFSGTLGAIIGMALERARAMESTESESADLPSDHLMREWVVSERRGQRTTLPVSAPSQVKNREPAATREAGQAAPRELVAEASAPEASAPEASAPEATAPEASAPEASAPEASAPEASIEDEASAAGESSPSRQASDS